MPRRLASLSGHSRIARRNPDGTLDPKFKSGAIPKGGLRSVVAQANGKILIGGAFNAIDNSLRNCIARLNGDGALDPTFDPGQGATDGSLWRVALETSGKVLIGGVFKDFNGVPCGRIARLNN